MKVKSSILIIVLFFVTVQSFAQFNQKGTVKEYHRREQKTIYTSPVEIVVKGASSTTTNPNGSFDLRFPMAHVGDTLSEFSIKPSDNKYTLFNATKIHDWVLTPNKNMEVLVSKKSIIDDIQKAYTKNYVGNLIKKYEKQRKQLEERLKKEKSNNIKLKDEISQLKNQFKIDSLEIVANSIAFAYVDESELDSLEIKWRDCIISGDNDEAVRIGNEMNLKSVSDSRLENLNKSVSITRDMLDKTFQTAKIMEQHIINLENQEQIYNSVRFNVSLFYIDKNESFYASLCSLYGRLYELYSTEIRCSEAFLNDLKEKYARSLYKYAYTCQREFGILGVPSGYTDKGMQNIIKSASLDNYDALLYLSERDNIPYTERKQYIKKAREINDNDVTRRNDWLLVDFMTIADNDTIFCHRLDSKEEIIKYGNNAVLLCDIHPSSKKKKLIIPSSFEHKGNIYFVKVLGQNSCRMQGNDISLHLRLFGTLSYIYPEDIKHSECMNKADKTELEISNGILTLDEYSIGDWFKKISIPKSVNEIYQSAIPSHKGIEVKLNKEGNYTLRDGILYSKDMHRIAAFIKDDIKEISISKDFKFPENFGGFLSPIQFPDSLRKFVVNPENPYYKSVNGILIDKQKDSLLYVPKCVSAIPLTKSMSSLIVYQTNGDINNKNARENKYITYNKGNNCNKYLAVTDADALDFSLQFNYFASIYYMSSKRDSITIIMPDGKILDVTSYINTLLPYMSNERLTFWGRTYLLSEKLAFQDLGLRLLLYAKEKYEFLSTDETDYPGNLSWLSKNEDLKDYNYTTNNKSYAENRIAALALDPNYNYESSIAFNLMHLGDFQSALRYAEDAIRKDSLTSVYLSNKSYILFEMGRYDDAIDAITSYIEKFDRADGYYRRAFYNNMMGKYELAIEDYNTYIKTKPSYAYAYLGRADMYTAMGDSILAKKDYEKVISLLNYGSDRCDQFAYCMLKDYTKAKTIMQETIEKYHETPGVYYDAACLYSRMGDYETSLTYLKTALEKGYRGYGHLMLDDDLEKIRNSNNFSDLMKEYFHS